MYDVRYPPCNRVSVASLLHSSTCFHLLNLFLKLYISGMNESQTILFNKLSKFIKNFWLLGKEIIFIAIPRYYAVYTGTQS